MKTKYADLIAQLERVTRAYSLALRAVKDLGSEVGDQPDILGVSGGVTYLGDGFEKRRAIHLSAKALTAAVIDYGSDFQHGECGDEYIRFDCTLFGYRVFCIAVKGSAEEAYLLDLAADEEKSNDTNS